MPDSQTLARERRSEHDAEMGDISARRQEEIIGTPPDGVYHDHIYRGFAGAAEKWRLIAEDYAAKENGARSGDEALDYLCRLARAWRKAAADYAKAAEHARNQADMNDNIRKEREAYKKAGELYERCANHKIERGEVAGARPCLEWAEICHLRAGEKEAAERVRRTAEAARRLLATLLGETVPDGN